MSMASRDSVSEQPRYLEARAPIFFPEFAQVPETQLHMNLRMLLYSLLREAFGDTATVCSDQFVYFDAEDPSQCLAPDAFVRQVPQTELIRTWKVWERGAPEVAVEIVSDSDAGEPSWESKLARYRRVGVSELVRFDPNDAQRPLRIWDRVGGALVERELSEPCAPSLMLPLEWAVAATDELPRALRIKRDGEWVQTDRESRDTERREKEAQRAAKEAERAAKEAAEARVAELEAELRRRDGHV